MKKYNIIISLIGFVETLAFGAHRPKHLKLDEISFLDRSEFLQMVCKGQTTDLSNHYLKLMNFENCKLNGVDFSGANLRGANLNGASLIGANLRGADLRGAFLINTNLTKAVMDEANISGASLNGVIARGASCLGTRFNASNLTGANFQGAAMSNATKFFGAVLTNAHLPISIDITHLNPFD